MLYATKKRLASTVTILFEFDQPKVQGIESSILPSNLQQSSMATYWCLATSPARLDQVLIRARKWTSTGATRSEPTAASRRRKDAQATPVELRVRNTFFFFFSKSQSRLDIGPDVTQPPISRVMATLDGVFAYNPL